MFTNVKSFITKMRAAINKKATALEPAVQQGPDLTQISLEQCLEVTPLIEIYQSRAQEQYLSELSKYVAPSVSVALQGASLCVQQGTMVVEFSKAGQRLLQAKELRIPLSGGKQLPKLINASGKYVENAKGISRVAKAGTKLANVAAIVVSAAHMISGADISARLKEVDRKLDFLIAARSLEQTARLESVFLQAREIMHLYDGEKRSEKLHDLNRLLFEGRSTWRREVQYHLANNQVSEKSASWLTGWFKNRSIDTENEKTAKAIARCETEIQMIHCSLSLQLAITCAANTQELFVKHSLPDELKQLDQMRHSMESLTCDLDAQSPEKAAPVKLAAKQLGNLVDLYQGVVSNHKAIASEPSSI